MRGRSQRCGVALAGVVVAACFSVNAEEGLSRSAEHSHELEEIVVTGSLIQRRRAYVDQGAVIELGAERFELSGAVQPVDLLKSMTINTGSTLANEQSSLQGTSQFSLRGLGLSSTLTLINSRRAGLAPVSPDTGHAFFDINILPLTMIDRVDVLKGGAAPTYGSQAVAGVVNIITRKGFEGLEFSGGYRDSSNSAYDLGLVFGKGFERGSVTVYGSHYSHTENFRSEFDWLPGRIYDPNGDGNILDGRMDSSRGSPGSLRKAVANPDGTFAPLYLMNPAGAPALAPRYMDPDCVAAGGVPNPRSTAVENGLQRGSCNLDFFDQRTTIAAEQRYQIFLEGEYNLAEGITFFTEAGFSRNEVTDRVGNLAVYRGNVEDTNGFFVPAEHPFNFFTDDDNDGQLEYVDPAAWTANHQAVDLSYFGRPLGNEANKENAGDEERRFDSVRGLVGLHLDLWKNWHATMYGMYSDNSFDLRSDRHWIVAEFARVIREGRWNPFGTRLASPGLETPKTAAQLGGLAGLAGVQAGNNAETQRLFEGVKVETAGMKQHVVEGVADGELFDLGDWGTLGLAVGMQYRQLEYHQVPDPINAAGGGPREGREFPKDASQKAYAVFAETLLAIGSDTELLLAVRSEHYDKHGDTTDPKVALRHFLTDWLGLRGSFATSFQAPSVFQVAGNVAAATLTDPFRDGACTVENGRITSEDGGNFITTLNLLGGDLKPQSAQSWDLGFDLIPLPSTRFSLDYWNFDYEDVISMEQSFQDILNQDCLENQRPTDQRVVRDSSGQLSSVTSNYINVTAVKTSGLDLEGSYAIDTPLGGFQLRAAGTLITKFDVRAGATSSFTDQLDNRNSQNGFGPSPDLRLNASLTWRSGSTTANLNWRYIDGYKNDEATDNPGIASWHTLDLHLSHGFKAAGIDNVTLSLGVNNLLDRDPPCLWNGSDCNLRPGYDGLVHDIRGRIIYARLKTYFGR